MLSVTLWGYGSCPGVLCWRAALQRNWVPLTGPSSPRGRGPHPSGRPSPKGIHLKPHARQARAGDRFPAAVAAPWRLGLAELARPPPRRGMPESQPSGPPSAPGGQWTPSPMVGPVLADGVSRDSKLWEPLYSVYELAFQAALCAALEKDTGRRN